MTCKKNFKWPRWLKVSATLTVILVAGAGAFYFYNFNNGFSNQETFGQFGDYVGGLLNPLLTFFTICLLIWSISYQIKELNASTNALVKTQEAHEDIKVIQEASLRNSESQSSSQIRLQSQDILRREIMDSMNHHFDRYESLFKKPIAWFQGNSVSLNMIYFDDVFSKKAHAANYAKRVEDSVKSSNDTADMITLTVDEIKNHASHLAEHYHEIQGVLKATSTKSSLKSRVEEIIDINLFIGITTDRETSDLKKLLKPEHASLGID